MVNKNMAHQISIIIPVLNEAETIGDLLKYLIENSNSDNISEIIVVDGGSSDGTLEIVKSVRSAEDKCNPETTLRKAQYNDTGRRLQSNILLIEASKGRAKQMNVGAMNAKGDILYFLHADSFPPNTFDALIIDEVQKGNKAGCFRMQFDSSHWWLKLASWLTQFSWRACRGGDQSQFITRAVFDAISGYDENYIIYEDNILINKLYGRKQFVVINKKIKTSARLYKKYGVWKLQYHFWTIYVKKWFGASAEELFAYYKKHI
jgi:rSAM/selenodomain-associated transferase 2